MFRLWHFLRKEIYLKCFLAESDLNMVDQPKHKCKIITKYPLNVTAILDSATKNLSFYSSSLQELTVSGMC